MKLAPYRLNAAQNETEIEAEAESEAEGREGSWSAESVEAEAEAEAEYWACMASAPAYALNPKDFSRCVCRWTCGSCSWP